MATGTSIRTEVMSIPCNSRGPAGYRRAKFKGAGDHYPNRRTKTSDTLVVVKLPAPFTQNTRKLRWRCDRNLYNEPETYRSKGKGLRPTTQNELTRRTSTGRGLDLHSSITRTQKARSVAI